MFNECLDIRWKTARFCILNFSFKNDFVWEEISNIRHSVSSPDDTPRSSSKILRCASYFQLSSRVFHLVMKHCISCFIYDLNCGNTNRPFSSCQRPLIQCKVKCEVIDMKMLIYSYVYYNYKTHFHKKVFPLSLVLKERDFGTLRWSI